MSIALIFMTYDPDKHHRRSIRLKGFDYSRSAVYFVTICVQNRECLFGTISQHKMLLNEAGQMVAVEWLALPTRFHPVILDDSALQKIQQYIQDNPLTWETDSLHPSVQIQSCQ